MQNSSPHTLQSITTYQKLRGASFDLILSPLKDTATNYSGQICKRTGIFIECLKTWCQHKSFMALTRKIHSGPRRAGPCHSSSSGPRRRGIVRTLNALMKR